jgi:protein phosphatase 1G
MGAYLSKPICEKESEDYASDSMRVGASAMQGWRMSQEDAHCCLLDFDTNTSLFAVYDGHGGSEVAKYTAAHFPEFLKTVPSYQQGQLATALEDAFLGFDSTLTTDDVKQQLIVLAAGGEPIDDAKDNDEDDAAETAMLCEEATMPIEKLLERYGGAGIIINRTVSDLKKPDGKNLSPVIRAKQDQASLALADGSTSPLMSNEALATRTTTDEVSEVCSNKSDKAVCVKLADKLVNGYCNDEAEIQSTVASDKADCSPVVDSSTMPSLANGDGKEIDISTAGDRLVPPVVEGKKSEGSTEVAVVEDGSGDAGCASIKSDKPTIDVPEQQQQPSTTSGEGSVADNEAEVSGSGAAGPSSSCTSASQDSAVGCSSSASTSCAPSCSKLTESSDDEEDTTEEEPDSDDDPDDVWNADAADSDSDDDDDDELGDDAEDEDDDDDEDEDGDAEELEPEMGFGEEPGADSGCTAVVALLHNNELYVANAGDSRCVLCRAGKAIEMSIDHKPEDTIEQDRIHKAGGRVTCDGRVNGGLNLSRAIGDHTYKKNSAISDRDQMITALPDVKSITLDDSDEFMVLACDGIWNVMSSQDVVDFVRARIQAGTAKLSAICEEMFEFCLAPDTSGDGTGCDNMTCVIVSFNGLTSGMATRTGVKRKADDNSSAGPNEESPETASKRPKDGD